MFSTGFSKNSSGSYIIKKNQTNKYVENINTYKYLSKHISYIII